MGRVLTRRAGVSPFPVDPEGERSEFREAESSRKSITLSMSEHGPRSMGRHDELGDGLTVETRARQVIMRVDAIGLQNDCAL